MLAKRIKMLREEKSVSQEELKHALGSFKLGAGTSRAVAEAHRGDERIFRGFR
ncbi:MAG: hypothetical protein LUD03_04065 [Firmicutes bacterium]|nr:hypothetical protein [Bacillota bacterium]